MMREIYFAEYPTFDCVSEVIEEKSKDTDSWKIKEYLERELLFNFEIQYGGKDDIIVMKMVGKNNYDDTIINLNILFKDEVVKRTENYYNDFVKINWNGDHPSVNGVEISEYMG